MEPLAETQPRGAFRWNRGGWFGAQLGGTCWLLILGTLIVAKDPLAGAVALACFAAANLYGWSLWRRRAGLSPYPCFRRLLLAQGLSALLAVVFVHLSDAMRHLPEGSQVSAPVMYGALLVYPGLMLMFHLQERAALEA